MLLTIIFSAELRRRPRMELRTIEPGAYSMAEARIVLTTLGDKDSAERMAGELVERRLAACVNIVGPIQSVYRWRGKMEREQEYLLLIKTTTEQTSRLGAAFKELHPYDLPERIEVSVEGGSEAYLAWIASEVNGAD